MNRFRYRLFGTEKALWLKGMHELKRFNFISDEYVCIETSDGLFNSGVSSDCITIMQSTGLFDNSHKLIYEGDIVRFSSLYGRNTYEIVWNEEYAAFGAKNEETDFIYLGNLYDDSTYVEILGNIYENPNLLN